MAQITKFNINVLTKKAGQRVLQHFGVQRNWARVTLDEMRGMLRQYNDERLFTASKAVVEREGGTFDETDFQLLVDEGEIVNVTDLDDEAVAAEQAEAANVLADQVQAKRRADTQMRERAEQNDIHWLAPATPDAPAEARPDVSEIAGLLAKLLSAGKQVDEPAVRRIADEVAAQHAVTNLRTLTAFVDNRLNTMPAREVNVQIGGAAKVVLKETMHPLFEKVLRLSSANVNVMLIGPAGCGKTFLAGQVARAMQKQFGSISGSAGVTEAQLLGRLLPTGDGGKFEYHESPFVRLYQTDGLFLFDEVDAFDSNVLLSVNSATANDGFEVEARGASGHPTFVKRHAGNVLMASANTFGTGADAQYVGRYPLDASTLDRWYPVVMGYNLSLEHALAGLPAPRIDAWKPYESDIEAGDCRAMGEWVLNLRAKANNAKLRRVISTRTLQKALAALRAGIPAKEIQTDLTTGWTKDELAKVA